MNIFRQRSFATHISLWPGVLIGTIGILIAYKAFMTWGEDFGQLYIAAKLLFAGRNVYHYGEQHAAYAHYIGHATTWGHFYTPATGITVAPLAIFPYPFARILWFALGITTVIWSVWKLQRYVAPKLNPGLCALAVGVLLCSSSVRWAFKVGQYVPLIVGLLVLFLIALDKKRNAAAAAIALFIACLKVTFALPLVGLMLLRRRFALAILVTAMWMGVNGTSVIQMGGSQVLKDYKINMADFERPDQLNYPDPRGVNSLARLDLPYLLNAISPDFQRSNRLSVLFSLALLGWLALEGLRAKETCQEPETSLIFLAPLCCLSLITVYHHHYDILILAVPVMVFLFGPPDIKHLPGAKSFVALAVLYGGLYPAAQFENLLVKMIGPIGQVFAKPIGCVVVCAMLGASLVSLRRYLQQNKAASILDIPEGQTATRQLLAAPSVNVAAWKTDLPNA